MSDAEDPICPFVTMVTSLPSMFTASIVPSVLPTVFGRRMAALTEFWSWPLLHVARWLSASLSEK
ncbi:MAG: hypothetical protein AW11_01353 [Candidatus Accumulibacter regalis]|uniref:Uncharacterized protein n=1 Tax=Accumulibacter regalis TaxID=522306 RepID=A0A011QKW1_ACCRE|nr:MAG: hypothetical protein AW11_01353 [Candidatus Accumulibacter regalis]